jgi:hypothetical protein
MGYNIEISFNLEKVSNGMEFKENIHKLASNYKCTNFYMYEDTDFYAKFKRVHGIMVVNFPEIEFDNFISFIRTIKKTKNCAIECIYNDSVASKLIYASGYYLTIINKQKAIDYKTYIKDKNFNDDEQALLDICFRPFQSNN